ncbi:MAG: MetQ/NlpA family ABC transporter substrate-binding protein [Gammaproteobacteria bacterium]|nr:MetQ/NlpA family ABC transporter substrate-binding protein [Gammaproteobacteria bacterium]
MRKIIFSILLGVIFSLPLTACHRSSPKDELQVGTISGPETELMQVAAQVAQQRYGLKVHIIEFSDYAIPNVALNEGSLDANMFQHEAYLKNTINQRHFSLVAVAKTFVYPMGIYSKKIKSLQEIPVGALVLIPNDPTNEARALLLLQKANLITLKSGDNENATVRSIQNNDKKLKIKEMDAAELPRTLDDAILAVINTNYAIPAGLTPQKDALFLEDKHSPYANLLVVREGDVNNPKIKQLIESLHSEQVKQKAVILFHGQAIEAW